MTVQKFSVQEYAAPSVLYKYMPVQDWLLAMLKGQSLRFSTRTSFNDPFDCRPSFRIGTSKKARDALHRGLKSRGLSPAKRIKAVSQATRMGDNFPTRQATENYLDRIGVLCLTSKWDNALMWSHYGNHHSGICIGMRTNIGIFKTSMKVVYADELPIIEAPAVIEKELYDKVFLTKARCWAYEEEWRIIKAEISEHERDKQFREFCCFTTVEEARSLADHRGAGIYHFPNAAIESIILGMRISKDDEYFVRCAAKDAQLNIPIFKISPPEKTYNLSRIECPA